jgi:hypothetical protein
MQLKNVEKAGSLRLNCLYFVAITTSMIRLLLVLCVIISSLASQGQTFEVSGAQESIRGIIGETLKAPVIFKNTSDKAIVIVVRKISQQIGTTQKNYFCFDNQCLDAKVEDYTLRLEPNQVITSLQIALDAGLAHGNSSVKFIAFNKFNSGETYEFDVNYAVEEREEKQIIFSSSDITLKEIYPNPVKDVAFIDYNVLDDRVQAKIIIHNILGNTIEEFPLSADETRVKINVDALTAGIYFYTLYLDNEGVITRKLILKK